MEKVGHSRAETILRFVLRYIGTVCLLALFAVFIPYAWMDAIHRWIGLGTLPSEPIVGYLTRSLSLLYAFVGAGMWLCSFDLARYRSMILFFGVAFILFGAGVFAIDTIEGLPAIWKYVEGPIVILGGVVLSGLARQVRVVRSSLD